MITPIIDLRNAHGPVRDQQRRSTCLAFSLSDLNGYHHNQPALLSAEYLYREAALLIPGWRPDDGLALAAALQAVQAPGQPLEAHCPYQPADPVPPLAPIPTGGPLFSGIYRQHPPVSHSITVALVDANQSIGVVVRMTLEFFQPEKDSAEVAFSPAYLPGHLHAVLAVGMGHHEDTGETHYLIRNSWGAGWGDAGHAWVPETYINTHAVQLFGA